MTEAVKSEAEIPLDAISFGVVTDSEGRSEEITAARVIARRDWKVIRTLGALPPFLSDKNMEKFVDDQPDLAPFKDNVPGADNVMNRIINVLAYFGDRTRDDGRNGLEIFLRVLAAAEFSK
jgi:hypothetical protein